jgi:2-polyprenyl-3-methyl-5-hydroxy-6-metoxy-1,4-benzoquinol methylase
MKSCALCSRRYGRSESLLYRKDGHDIVRCPECRLVCRYELPSREDLKEIYRQEYFADDPSAESRLGYFDYLADEKLHRANAARRLRSLERMTDRRTLLDVGCAAGFFVDEAGRRGWAASGVDVSGFMVGWGRANLGVDISLGTLDEIAVDPGLGVVTMWDYIEHAIDPVGDITTAGRLLESGGILAISTGDIASIAARVSRSSWHLLTPNHHNYFFSAATLQRMLRRCGFEPIHVRHPGAAYSLAHVVYKLETLLPATPLRRAARAIDDSRLANAPLRLNLGDIVTVVARKAQGSTRRTDRPAPTNRSSVERSGSG